MYTLYNASKQFLENGVYHIRNNGEIVRRLTKEDAVYVKKATSKAGENEFYFYIIEYEEGDCIKLTNFMGKDWTTLLQSVANDINAATFFINTMCRGLKRENKPFPKNLDILLKEVVPVKFKSMCHASYEPSRYSYFSEFSWIIEFLGKKLSDYVCQSDIEEYASAMIKYYEFGAIEMLLKEKDVKISEEKYLAYEKAKKDLTQTIEQVKEKLKNRRFASVSYQENTAFPNIAIYLEDSPCGVVRVYINPISNYYNSKVNIHLFIENESCYSNTKIDIYEDCKAEIESLKDEIYRGGNNL